MQLSEDQILALAPDEASKKAGRDLANPNKWVSKGINEAALWGECQGSGSKPYQTQIDLSTISFKCSCPSRKFPCKHGLGLMLFNAKHNTSFTESTPPQWVSDWLGKRTEKAEKKAEQKEKPVDEVAQAKRQKAREQLVDDGINDLLLWMKDLVRNGIITIPENGTAVFDNLAKRMIDAKAPGLATMIKGLGSINYYKEGWQSLFMNQLTRIYLVIAGFKNKEILNPVLLEDVRSSIGFTQNQEELKEQEGIADNWFVLGKQVQEEDAITTERNWLYGTKTKQYALVLQFSVRGQGITFSLTPGICIEAELVFFPSVSPLRAIIKKQINAEINPTIEGFTSWEEIAMAETSITTKLPYYGLRPFIIQQITPVNYNSKWWLKDSNSNLVMLNEGFVNIYKLLSLSGGKPLNMAVIGKENEFEPIGVWTNNQYINI